MGQTGGRGGQGAWLVLGADGRKGDISGVIVQPHYSSDGPPALPLFPAPWPARAAETKVPAAMQGCLGRDWQP